MSLQNSQSKSYQKIKNKNILLTGGTGFIGSNLGRKLLSLKANVNVYDRYDGNDICDKKNLKKFIARQYDVIFHLAGFSGSKESNENIEQSFKINTLATIGLFELVLKYSPKTKIILSSSRLEYGKPQYLPVDEKHPTNPTSAYGLSKLAATQMALIYHQKDNLDVTIFRTSNVYGQHQYSKFGGYNIINHFTDLAQEDKTLTIYGDGNQKRDYLYIEDLIDAFLLAIDKKTSGKIYNLGFGQEIKFKDMAKLIIKIVGQGRLKFVNWPRKNRNVETGDYISDISKIENDLGFKPKIDFQLGILKTFKFL